MNTDKDAYTRRLAFWLVLAVGAALRLYRLDVPSMWWDEILVPLTASHPVAYIVDFCRSAEMHPPLFYLFSKAHMALGDSDMALRLPAALLGTAALWGVYRVAGEFFDKDSALVAMALMSVNGLHILLSREIRPYALQIVLLLWVWLALVRLVRLGRAADLAVLCGVNALLLLLHYFSFHLALAQGAALLACLVMGGARVRFSQVAAFGAACLAVGLPVLAFFFLPSAGSRSILTHTQYSHADVFKLIVEYVSQALYFFGPGWPVWGMAALVAVGLVMGWLRNREATVCAVSLAVVPLGVVLAMGKAAYFSPWHVAYVAPLAVSFAALPLSAAALAPLGRRALAALVALGLGANVYFVHYDRFYQPDSYRHMAFVTMYKLVAQPLAGLLSPSDAAVCSEPGFANGVRWYLNRTTGRHPLASQDISPRQQEVVVRFISAFKDFGALGADEAAFLAKTGPPARVDKAVNATVYTFATPRDPVAVCRALPFTGGLRAEFPSLYAKAHSIQDAAYTPSGGGGVTALGNDKPGVLEYVLENRAGPGPQIIFVNLMYANTGRGNLLGLFYRFDDEPMEPLAGSLGPDRKHQTQAVIRRDKPYTRLLVRVELRCAPLTATYHGGNLETLAFKDLQVYLCAPDAAAACQSVWERQHLESLQKNFNGEGLIRKSSVRQYVEPEKSQNVDDAPSGHDPAWRMFTPADPDKPAVLRLAVEPGKGLVFFPRLCGPEAFVRVWASGADGVRREVFLACGVPDVWSPIGARFELDVPGDGGKTTAVEIELFGRGAQVWHSGGKVFY